MNDLHTWLEAAGATPMTVDECFEEAQKKMAINGECIHELEKACVDHFETHGDAEKAQEAKSMIGSWERKVGNLPDTLNMDSSSDRKKHGWILTFISISILLTIITN